MKSIIYLLLLFFTPLITLTLSAQPESAATSAVFPEKLHHPQLAEKFYSMRSQQMFWFQQEESIAVRQKLVQLLAKADYLALDKDRYHYRWLSENTWFATSDTSLLFAADKVYTDAVIAFCKDIYQGADIEKWLQYDEISPQYQSADNSYILMGLASVNSANELEWFTRFLEPSSLDYIRIKQELRSNLDSCKMEQVEKLIPAMNLLRWVRHFNFEQYVVVNAASATVRYYDHDTLNLRMKAVVGTVTNPTPRFAGYCNEVVLYPYWHVPYSIAVNEILPLVKRNRNYLVSRNLQVIDKQGRILEPSKIDWSVLNAKNFPYQFRQSTGCDNALGVIKFNLTDPFSVYMHDTNNKTAFLAGSRYFSHGCIRLEKPVDLANALLPGKIDPSFLEACNRNQKPVVLKVAEPVPVFVLYMAADFNEDNTVSYHKDVYRLLQ